MAELRKSGIEVLGDIPWGTHFCNFYETKQDLLDIVVPYFKMGLESNEFCLWVVSDSGLITVEEANKALKQVVPDFERHVLNKNIEILNEIDWYLKEDLFNLENALSALHEKLKQALDRGFAGVRASGDTFWLNENSWKDFFDYEKDLNDSVTGLPVTILCTYPLEKSGAAEILDVALNHQFAIARRKGEWEAIETATKIQAQAEASRLNTILQQIKRRTPVLPAIAGYGVAILSVIATVIILLLLNHDSGGAPHVSLFLCAVILSSWIGGSRSGLLATILSALAFDYYFLLPVHSFAIETTQIPRLVLYAVTALFVVSLSSAQRSVIGSLRRARNILEVTVQKLDETNIALRQEIDEHKKSELRVVNEKELSEKIIDSIPGLFELYNKDFRFLRWNKQFEGVSGYSPDEIPNLHVVEDLCFGEEREKKYRILEKINKTGRYEGEITITAKGGKTIPLYFVGQLINYEGESCIICTAIDISERKRIEEDLKRSELRYRTLVEQASDAIIITDQKGNLVEMNTSFCKMFGYSEKELLGMNMAELVDPDQLKNDPLRLDLLLDGKSIFRERRMKKKDGTIFEVEANVQMITDKRILAIVRDITDRKKAEELLRQSENQLAQAQAIAHIGSWAWDLPDNIVTWSDELYRIFGLKPQENGIGHWVMDLIHPEDRDWVTTTLENSIKTKEPYSIYYRLTRPDGNERIVQSRGEIITDKDGNAIRVLGTTQDVTEQKRAEDALRRSEDRTRLIIDTIPTMAWSLGPNGVVDFLSQRWLDYSGLSLEQYVNDPEGPIHPDDRIRVMEKWKKYMAAGEFHEDEMRLRRADGKYRWFLVRTAPLQDEQGNIVKWYGVSTDIEDRKRAEYELRQSNEEIRRLTEHLQKIREEERIHIAREIHDELGQQLTAIKMDVVWIDKKISENTPDIKGKIKNIIRLLDGSNESVRRILSELRPWVLDEYGLLEAIESLGRQFTETTGVAVKFASPEKEIKISQQIATNIFRICQEAFTNIARHSHAKNISVTISIVEENIILVIEDNGTGFDPASVQNIKSFGILGMRERVISLGGKFELVSSPGRGTKITVGLPYEE